MKFGEIITDMTVLAGEQVEKVYFIPAEYGRTYNFYLGLVTSSGTRFLCPATNNIFSPSPKFEAMKDCAFFTPEEVAERAREDAKSARGKIKQAEDRERTQYEKLKSKFEK